MVRRFLDLATREQAYGAIATLEPLGTERVEARRAAGRVVAETVTALEDVPTFERSNMDGFAVRAADTYAASEHAGIVLRVSGSVAMGTAADAEVNTGYAVRVSTGAMLPPGADAVVIVEHTEATNGGDIVVRHAATPGQNIIRAAEDLAKGDVVLARGRRMKGGDVGALTGSGHANVLVHRVPRVGVIVTGDEIVEPGASLGPGQVRNVNEYSLLSLARLAATDVTSYGVCPDDERQLRDSVARAARENDVVLVSGGSSKGERDLTRGTFESVGAEILLHGIAIAPGKPTILARCERTVLMGLPGNPAAAVVVFTLFCAPLVRVLEGESLARVLLTQPRMRARLQREIRSTPGREDFVRVRIESDPQGPVAIAQTGKSVAISTIAGADGLVCVPLARDRLDAGCEVEVLLL